MENLELVEKRLKKMSSKGLIEKLEKNKFSQAEVVSAISLLEGRNQDVSAWKQVEVKIEEKEVETPKALTKEELKAATEQKRQVLVEKVDAFIDTLIDSKRSGVYTEAMKALGGSFESDLDDLLENATIEQLNDALSFNKIIKASEKVEVKKSKTPAKTSKKDAPVPGSKSEAILKYMKENPEKTISEVAKDLNTHYPFVSKIKKTYLTAL